MLNGKSRPTLFSQIKSMVLPKLLLLISAFVMLIALAFFYVNKQQVDKQHALSKQQFISNIESNISNLVSTIEGLSQNDLLINSLIDFQMRNEYLPLFFQSLKVNKVEHTASALFDFSGDIILQNNWPFEDITALAPMWQDTALTQGEPVIKIARQGVVVIIPINLNGMPEGAIGIYIKHLSAFIDENSSDSMRFMFDDSQTLVYASPNAKIDKSDLGKASYDELLNKLSFMHVSQQSWKSFTIVLAQPYASSYAESYWLLPFLFAAIIGTIVTSLAGVHSAASKASLTLKAMNDSLVKVSDSTKSSDISDDLIHAENEAQELAEIRASFYTLVNQVVMLSLSNNKFTNVMNSMQELLLVLDFEGNILLSNDPSTRFFHVNENKQGEVIEKGLACIEGASASSFLSYSRKNDQEQTINWNVMPFIDEKGQHLGVILSGEDISATLALKQDVRLRTQALEFSSAAITISDVSIEGSPLIYINQAFTAATGYSKSDALGHNCKFLQGKNTEPEAVKKIRHAIANKEPCHTLITNYKKDGTPFINALSLKPVFEQDGSVKYYVGVQQDVTVEKQTEQYLAQAKDKAEASVKAQSRFFASINHELRTPINGINGMLKALLNSELDNEQTKYAKLATQSANNLRLLINDVLDYSKAEAGQLSINNAQFDLSNLCESLHKSYLIQCQDKKLKLEWENQSDLNCCVVSDPLRLQQIMDNLFSNALKFTDEGKISVRVSLEDAAPEITASKPNMRKLNVSIRDTGIGIPPDQINKVFKMFEQVEAKGKRVNSGTGLGLNICQLLLKLMDGDINVSSKVDFGSEFSFFVHLEAKQKQVQINKDRTTGRVSDMSEFDDAPVVLIVEDNEINQQVVLAHLKLAKKLVAVNGLKALDILNGTKAKIDVILMDCQMPELDGWDTTRLIRSGHAGDTYKDTPIIALTAYTSADDKKKCTDAGMDDLLSKPFEPDILIEKVIHWTKVSRQAG